MRQIIYDKVANVANDENNYISTRRLLQEGVTNRQIANLQEEVQVPGKKDNIDEEKMCTGCQYHRKDFAYRYCLHTECPYVKGHKTFRKEAYEIGSK